VADKIQVPIPVLHLFQPLEDKLIEVLGSLSDKEWNYPTVAKQWTVKDVAAHLLDGQIRVAAQARNYFGDPPDAINSYADIVSYLNRLNHDWVKAMKRVSPHTIIDLLQSTQKEFIGHYHSLDLMKPAMFSVAWAGDEVSPNWFHVAREYTERWHHQQQIRDAVKKQGIMRHEFFYPMIQTFMMALPHTYRNTKATEDVCLAITITGEAGGEWKIQHTKEGWKFSTEGKPETTIEMDADTSWKLFTKALAPADAAARVKITGNPELGTPVLSMVAVMA